MFFLIKQAFIALVVLSSCSSINSVSSEASVEEFKRPKKFFKKADGGQALKAPCINLFFVDRFYPALINESIRLYQPKVGIKSAFKITKQLLKDEKLSDDYAVDSSSGKLCKQENEFGYSFKVNQMVKN